MMTRPVNNSQGPSPPKKEHRLRILLYEPEEGSREYLCEALKKEHDVVSVRPMTGDFKNHRYFRSFDILILNPEEKKLPDLLRSIYSHYREEKPWLIVTSEREEIRLELKKLKTDRLFFIPKPYDLDVIEKTIDKIIQWEGEKKDSTGRIFKRLTHLFR
jgi:DNA-binding NtrC family response regulator